ncbi:hypothetical protein ACFOVU_17480 [Nocardiopsis sediminis]|uniref:Uncharacterized protein n=1 Tax=Nocardiopsis sediminis TaxID=1778267 RepID=A0ABV8FNU2_9ACTN
MGLGLGLTGVIIVILLAVGIPAIFWVVVVLMRRASRRSYRR